MMGKVQVEQLEKLRVWEVMRKLYGATWAQGRISWNSGLFVDLTIDVQPDNLAPPQVRLSYSVGEEKILYPVHLTETTCHLGGKRHWFKCPLLRDGQVCHNRVGVLYFSGKYFGCRHCLDLTYQSKSVNFATNSTLRLFSLRMRANELEERMKRYTWRGKDTRQMRQLRKLYNRMGCPKYPDALLRFNARRKKNAVTTPTSQPSL